VNRPLIYFTHAWCALYLQWTFGAVKFTSAAAAAAVISGAAGGNVCCQRRAVAAVLPATVTSTRSQVGSRLTYGYSQWANSYSLSASILSGYQK